MQRNGMMLTSDTVVVPVRGLRRGRRITGRRGAMASRAGALADAHRQVIRGQVIETAVWLLLAASALAGLVICFWA